MAGSSGSSAGSRTVEFARGSSNESLWTIIKQCHSSMGTPLSRSDMYMYSRWMGYSTPVMCLAFVPTIIGFIMLISLIVAYGRFPPNQDGTYGGRLKKMKRRSSWKRERRDKALGEYQCSDDKTNKSLDQDHWKGDTTKIDKDLQNNYYEETNNVSGSGDGVCVGGRSGCSDKGFRSTLTPGVGFGQRIYRLKQVFRKSKTTNL
ncbi:unnamed protein product, partial [Meganyctiphanes norvegica]